MIFNSSSRQCFFRNLCQVVQGKTNRKATGHKMFQIPDGNKCISTSSNKSGRLKLVIGSRKTNLQKTKQVKYSDEFLEEQLIRYNLSKNRLANMMGENPDKFTQERINKAIRYLFPSGLKDPEALPELEHPDHVFLSRQKILWDENRRPFHYLYYTKRPLFYSVMHDIYENILKVQQMVDQDRKLGHDIVPGELNLSGTRWINTKELDKRFLKEEKITPDNFAELIMQLERLIEEPYADKVKDFIDQFRVELPVINLVDNILPVSIDQNGRKFVEETSQRKTAFSHIKLYPNGTGKITVNGQDFDSFFNMAQDRETVLAPFTFCGCLLKYDVEANVEGGHTVKEGKYGIIGEHQEIKVYKDVPKSAQAGAIRHAVARALRSFLNEEEIEMMRRAGLLTEDKRYTERSHPGKRGARRSPIWKAR